MKAKYFICMILILLYSCGGGDTADENITVPAIVTPEPVVDPPAAAILVFPKKDEVCEPGTADSETKAKINFQWNSATNAESYDLKITNLDKNSVDFGKFFAYELNSDSKETLYIPAHYGHGFLAKEETTFFYFCFGKYSENNEITINLKNLVKSRTSLNTNNWIISQKDEKAKCFNDIFKK